MALKFKSRTETPVRVALTSGHVALIGPEWVELAPMFHAGALAQGCITNEMQTLPEVYEPEAGTPEAGQADIIRMTLEKMLDSSDKGYFTAAGQPDIRTVRRLSGMHASRDVILSVWAEMQ